MAIETERTQWPPGCPGKERQLRLRRTIRLFRIIALLQEDYYRTPAELCKELEISRRTLQRDIALLRRYGVDIQGHPGRYRLVGPRW